MKQETMSVHRALAELTLLDKKIIGEISHAKFADKMRKAGKTIDGKTPDIYKKNSKSSLQAIDDLITRRDAIKSALLISNATTKVTVDDVEMTVAEAIDKKNTIKVQQEVIKKLKATYKKVHDNVKTFNENLDSEALYYFQEITQNKDKLNESAFKALVAAYKEERELQVIEGFDIEQEIQKRETKYVDFLMNVDFVLSESNTETKITIEY